MFSGDIAYWLQRTHHISAILFLSHKPRTFWKKDILNIEQWILGGEILLQWSKLFRMLFHNILVFSYPIFSANADRYFWVSGDYLETFPRVGQLTMSYRSLLLSEFAIFSCLLGKLHFHMLQILWFQIYFPYWNEKSFRLKSFAHKHDYSEEKKPNKTEKKLPP